MNTQIKIDLEQAPEFKKLGYTVTCFAAIPKLKPNGTGRTTKHTVINSDELFTYNITGSPVAKGNYKAVWETVVDILWKKDIAAKYTRSHIESLLYQNGLDPKDKSMFAWLANKKRIIKRTD